MTSRPSPRPGTPPRSRGSRILLVLRSRPVLCGFSCGAAGYLQGPLSRHFSVVFHIYAHPIASVITTQVVVLIVLAARFRAGAVRGSWRIWNSRGRYGAPVRHASGHAMPPVSGPVAGAAWQVMRAAAKLMPRAAGSRWLAEAASFLSEAPTAQRRRALRSYLAAVPPTVLASWAAHLARRTRTR